MPVIQAAPVYGLPLSVRRRRFVQAKSADGGSSGTLTLNALPKPGNLLVAAVAAFGGSISVSGGGASWRDVAGTLTQTATDSQRAALFVGLVGSSPSTSIPWSAGDVTLLYVAEFTPGVGRNWPSLSKSAQAAGSSTIVIPAIGSADALMVYGYASRGSTITYAADMQPLLTAFHDYGTGILQTVGIGWYLAAGPYALQITSNNTQIAIAAMVP